MERNHVVEFWATEEFGPNPNGLPVLFIGACSCAWMTRSSIIQVVNHRLIRHIEEHGAPDQPTLF